MGRRSINTTKSGKYMNPTDQARKEARKKELKKNKRQRQMVRAAVLKMKDPCQILEELQKIDEMEYNVLQPSPLNEKVLKEKRKKLKETFDRVLKMYDKDEPEKWADLKHQEMEYEKKRIHLISYFESVKHAQSVQVHEIPLPSLQLPDNIKYANVPSQIPLPVEPEQAVVPKPILKKDTAYAEPRAGAGAGAGESGAGRAPPGPPPGPAPALGALLAALAECRRRVPHADCRVRFQRAADDSNPPGEEHPPPPHPPPPHPPHLPPPPQHTPMEVSENVAETTGTGLVPPQNGQAPPPGGPAAPPAVAPKPTSLQQRMLALSGQNIDEFMKEMEEVHKKRERDRAADLNARLSALKRTDRRDSDSDSDSEIPGMPPGPPGPPPGPPGVPPGPPPGHPGIPPGPPGVPPPIVPPQPLPPGMRGAAPPLLGAWGARALRPPGPPPGAPPRLLRAPPPPPAAPPHLAPLAPLAPPLAAPLAAAPPSVLSAAPQLILKKDGQGATISAKPQIRNLSADVTRFVPSALRVKREETRGRARPAAAAAPPPAAAAAAVAAAARPTKDDAYMQFMKEMQGLL